MTMKIFLAGGTGVLGRATVPRLVAAGHEVTAVARSEAKAAQLRDQGAEPCTLDLFDAAAVRAAVEGHDAVIHMATSIPPLSRALRSGAWATNDRLRREGTQILADAARDAGAQVFIKELVCFFYPDRGAEWIDEDVPRDRAPFSAASLDAEDIALAFTGDGRRGIALRFGLFYSADGRSTQEGLRLARFGIGPMMGLADAYQPSIHVDDAAAAVVAALEAPAGAYNVADEPITKGEWNEAFRRAFGLRRKLRSTPRLLMKLGGRKIAVLGASRRDSSRRFRDATGWVPVHRDATVGLEQVAAEHAKAAS
jgi:nucleoside-diphosphate-sugar epimerase